MNQTRLLNSDDVARQTFVDHYGSSSFKEANDLGNQNASTLRKHKHVGFLFGRSLWLKKVYLNFYYLN